MGLGITSNFINNNYCNTMVKHSEIWFRNYADFIPKEITIEELDIHVVGYFPYETAMLPRELPKVPSQVFWSMLNLLKKSCGIYDNKFVLVTESPDNAKIAFFVKDGWVRVGTWDQIEGYAGSKLKLITNE